LAKELAPVGVRVNMISPGKMENSVDLIDNRLADNGFGLPMRRPASLEEIAALFRFLLSEEAGYITGQNIEIAGGFRLI
jgi:NAD(P)-dependent dehydrogenase (short-subunit alcohol dehydrogenase family)